MTEPRESGDLETLLAAARRSSPTTLDPQRARAMAERAIARASARRAARRRTALGSVVALGVAAAAVFFVVRGDRSSPVPDGDASVVARTRAGDVLERTEATELAIVRDEMRARRVQLRRGTALFDVRPLGGDGSFEVDAGATEIRVRGTVFSVTRERATVVRVYEGRVEVRHAARTIEVLAGEQWSSEVRRVARLAPGPLETSARRAASRRATTTTSPSPSSAPVATPVPQEPVVARAEAHGTATEPTAPTTDARPEARTPARGPDVATTSASGRAGPRQAELALRDGRADEALRLAREGLGRGESGWSMVRADALRELGRSAEAADAYDEAARHEPGARATAAYSAALLRSRTLGDPAGALRSLDAGRVTESPLAERGLVLRVRLLLALGRDDDARLDARRYLERFPDRGSAASMRSLLGE